MRKHIAGSLSVALLLMVVLTMVLSGCGSNGRVPASLADVPRIRALELKALIDSDDTSVVVVDTRSFTSFQQGHIPGALSIPTEETEARYGELDKNSTIVTYCT